MNDDPLILEPVSLGELGLKYTPGDEPRSVNVQTFRTGKRFSAEAVRAGLEAGKLGRAMEFGFLLYLSDPDEPDVRAVLGRQGDTRFRVYNPSTEQVQWYSIPRTITVSCPSDFCLLASQSRSCFRRCNQRGKKHTLAANRANRWDKRWEKGVG